MVTGQSAQRLKRGTKRRLTEFQVIADVTNTMKTNELKHPSQPIGYSDHDTIRFKQNAIVDFLVKDARPGYDMNTIVTMAHHGKFSNEDLVQFYQLIGYSVCGYCDLSLVPEEEKDRAWAEQARLNKEKEHG